MEVKVRFPLVIWFMFTIIKKRVMILHFSSRVNKRVCVCVYGAISSVCKWLTLANDK